MPQQEKLNLQLPIVILLASSSSFEVVGHTLDSEKARPSPLTSPSIHVRSQYCLEQEHSTSASFVRGCAGAPSACTC
ncbi:hypothetical protein EVAR_59738_1 [Eumeta japonica]|uniref:Uncharacterized protein n=1 Tax=Eumeta variegata TaxID=151549 RepID=A0A4C1Z3V8_EUMVA|nr:hypothetical protein EVAR_59738_1 [Eumeta japonica]